MPIYKHGKQTTPITLEEFEKAMGRVKFDGDKELSYKSYTAFLYWFGVRRGEALRLTTEHFSTGDGNLLIVDCPAEKGGEREPLEIPANYPFVDLIIGQVKDAITKGRERVWPFSSVTAWAKVKKIMGKKLYPHFFRLNRATRFLEDPTTTLPQMKAWFGWKRSKTVDPYIGYSRRHVKEMRVKLSNELEDQSK